MERHPLDDFDDESPTDTNPIGLAHPLLYKYGLRILIAGFIVLFTSGSSAVLAPANSNLEFISSSINRMGAIALLVGFVVILIAYRIPNLPIDNATIANLIASIQFRVLLRSALMRLLIGNALTLLFLFVLLSMPMSEFRFWFLFSSMAVAFALLVTMIVYHTDLRRAYAIGFLCAYTLHFLGTCGFWVLSYQPYAVGPYAYPSHNIFSLVTGMLSGLICAAYFQFFVKPTARSKSEKELPAPRMMPSDDSI